jgi:hypothetical protein
MVYLVVVVRQEAVINVRVASKVQPYAKTQQQDSHTVKSLKNLIACAQVVFQQLKCVQHVIHQSVTNVGKPMKLTPKEQNAQKEIFNVPAKMVLLMLMAAMNRRIQIIVRNVTPATK